MKTEEEARQCWCPFARASIIQTNGNHSANRYAEGGNHPNATCIASECMAWRWAALGPKGNKGHCGLAGKP